MRALFEEVAPIWRHRCLILATQHPPTVEALRRRARRHWHKGTDGTTPRREKPDRRKRQQGETKPPTPRTTIRLETSIKYGTPSDPAWPPFPIFAVARVERTEAQTIGSTAELLTPLAPASTNPRTVVHDTPVIYAEGTLFPVFRKHAASDKQPRSANIEQTTAAVMESTQAAEALPRGSPKPLPLTLPYVSDEHPRSANTDQPTAAVTEATQAAEALPRDSPKPLPLNLPYVKSGNSIPPLVECYNK